MACSPQWGSEPGGLALAAAPGARARGGGAHARVLPQPPRAGPARHGLQHVQVHCLQAPAFGWHPHRQLNSRLYDSLVAVAGAGGGPGTGGTPALRPHPPPAPRGTLRLPCFLGGLGVRAGHGPLGGGDTAPMRLYAGVPWRHPRAGRRGCRRWPGCASTRLPPSAAPIGPRAARAQQTLDMLPGTCSRALILPEIGSPGDQDLPGTRQAMSREAAPSTGSGTSGRSSRRFHLLSPVA
jgi:hypothetical protein